MQKFWQGAPMKISLMILFLAVGTAAAVEAMVVQKRGTALSFNNVITPDQDVIVKKKKTPKPVIAVGNGDGKNNNPAIAQKLFADSAADKPFVVDLKNVVRQRVILNSGGYVAFEMDELGTARWHADADPLFFEYVKTQKQGNVRIFVYKTLKEGMTTLYFDYLDENNGKVVVLGSKVVNAEVK